MQQAYGVLLIALLAISLPICALLIAKPVRAMNLSWLRRAPEVVIHPVRIGAAKDFVYATGLIVNDDTAAMAGRPGNGGAALGLAEALAHSVDPLATRVLVELAGSATAGVFPAQSVVMWTDAARSRRVRGVIECIADGTATVLPENGDFAEVGALVSVGIVRRRVDRALLVPNAAVLGQHVRVVENGRIQSRRVVTGIVGMTETQILSGLSSDESVIDPVRADLADGQRVRVRVGG